jgi:hypothetical protein
VTAEITGSCFCKTVQYRITSTVAMVINCHCNHCKKAGGGAFASLAVVREKQLEIDELGFRRQAVKDRISRTDEEIILIENRIMEMQSQIDSVESFVQKNLEF